jgi:hypothetical protein
MFLLFLQLIRKEKLRRKWIDCELIGAGRPGKSNSNVKEDLQLYRANTALIPTPRSHVKTIFRNSITAQVVS